MRHYMKLITVILICLLFISSLLFYKKAFAAIGFGGTILYMQPCSNGILLLVGPPVGGIFLLPPVAKIYPFYSVKIGSWLLGSYSPGGACNMGPVTVPTQGTIIQIGTSK